MSSESEWDQLYGIKKKDLNARDLAWACFGILIELSRIVVSSLLVVFVPQNCDGSTCSIRENFEALSETNKFTLGFNFITLGVMLLMYLVIYRREKFLIYRLDENAKLPKTNCIEVFKDNPEIENGVFKYNRLMFYWGVTAAICYTINMVVSAITIFVDYYDGYQSVVQYLVNTSLCIYLIYRSILHSRSDLILSNTSFLPVTFNAIDQDYLIKKQTCVI